VCKHCLDDSIDIAVREAKEEWELERDVLEPDDARALARAYRDIQDGRYRDAMDRMERTLDDVAPIWRDLA
jgi:hypothetical protein